MQKNYRLCCCCCCLLLNMAKDSLGHPPFEEGEGPAIFSRIGIRRPLGRFAACSDFNSHYHCCGFQFRSPDPYHAYYQQRVSEFRAQLQAPTQPSAATGATVDGAPSGATTANPIFSASLKMPLPVAIICHRQRTSNVRRICHVVCI
eukprot:Gb_26593 [translate_table: standard]